MQKRLGVLVLVGCLCVTSSALADPPLHLLTPSTLTTEGGSTLRLPPSYVLSEPAWSSLDVEMKRLQDVETRLKAENGSLRAAVSGWQPGFYTLAIAIVSGMALAVYVDRKL